ncbi:MAG TPA: tripartite tricarboxylate transporter substrate binding protein [Vineibacter sp.]|nr:tripartite tricarboxylate transporter substrate binding protein [Vineibacter sp.]
MSIAMTRRQFGASAAALAASAAGGVPPAAAQGYPNKAITVVVPFPPGGTTDVIGRLVAQEMSKSMGQPIVVDNKAGANGNIGSAQVAKATPNGYTLLVTGVGSNAVNHGLYAQMPYDSRKDFAHVTQLTSGPNVLVVNPAFPAKSFKELIALLKANPGKYNYASSGNGASGHMAMEFLKISAEVKVEHIPYKGGAPALNDVIAGEVPMMFINQDMPLPHMRTGKLRVLAVASLERNPSYPDTPTIAESGYPGFAAVSWNGLAAPAGTPKEIIDKLHAEAVKALNSPAIKDKLLEQGFVPGGMSPADMAAFVGAEMDKWAKVAKASGAKIE